MISEYVHAGTSYSVRLEPLPDGRYTAVIGDRRYTLAATPTEGGWWLALGDQTLFVATAADGETRFVQAGGQTATLTRADNRPRRRTATAASGGLTAQMPGQVTAVLVAEGDTVERGQALLVLEAMKMEMRVSAPGPGRVYRLLVAPGDVVERGQALVEMSGEG